MKRLIKELGYWFEDRLKDLCGEITPDKRLIVILITLLFFTILNLYVTFTVISNWGREQERKEHLKIEHIKTLEIEKRKRSALDFLPSDQEADVNQRDSINQ